MFCYRSRGRRTSNPTWWSGPRKRRSLTTGSSVSGGTRCPIRWRWLLVGSSSSFCPTPSSSTCLTRPRLTLPNFATRNNTKGTFHLFVLASFSSSYQLMLRSKLLSWQEIVFLLSSASSHLFGDMFLKTNLSLLHTYSVSKMSSNVYILTLCAFRCLSALKREFVEELNKKYGTTFPGDWRSCFQQTNFRLMKRKVFCILLNACFCDYWSLVFWYTIVGVRCWSLHLVKSMALKKTTHFFLLVNRISVEDSEHFLT